MSGASPAAEAALPAVKKWLSFVAFLIFCMVLVGGATRLTNSGLSITEWSPIMGAIPPLSEADWTAAFDKYKAIPQYTQLNSGMSLGEFKVLYGWEWAHRFLGRAIGAVFAAGFLFFLARRQLEGRQVPRLLGILILGGLQGALGWYMVASGLVGRVDVSQYRLAAHLSLAALIFAAVLWVRFGLSARRHWPARWDDWFAVLLLLVVFVQLAAGAFVAGLDAGQGYNTWPRMDGQWIPDGLGAMQPAWKNLFENALAVQFQHRMIAYAVFVLVVIQLWRTFSLSAGILACAVFVQVALGVVTLLLHASPIIALVHQAGAMLVLMAAVWHLHRRLAMPAPDPSPQ